MATSYYTRQLRGFIADGFRQTSPDAEISRPICDLIGPVPNNTRRHGILSNLLIKKRLSGFIKPADILFAEALRDYFAA